jgi:hypothetical protein
MSRISSVDERLNKEKGCVLYCKMLKNGQGLQVAKSALPVPALGCAPTFECLIKLYVA